MATIIPIAAIPAPAQHTAPHPPCCHAMPAVSDPAAPPTKNATMYTALRRLRRISARMALLTAGEMP